MQLQLQHLTDDLRTVLQAARREAEHRHNVFVDVEHLMLGLLKHEHGTAWDFLQQRGIDVPALFEQVASAVGVERPAPIEVKGYSRVAQAALIRAQDVAHALGHVVLGTGHLLLSLCTESDGVLSEALGRVALNEAAVRAYVAEHDPPRMSLGGSPVYLPGPSRAPSILKPRSAGDSATHAAPKTASDSTGKAAQAPPEVLLVPTRAGKPKNPANASGRPAVPNWAWVLVGMVALLAYLALVVPGNEIFVFIFVLGGWVVSVTLHEFAHALVAYWGGDYTVKDKGYLSLNPLRYTHPLLSIAMPLMFLALGGIGLPGGAVYIEVHRLRSKWWRAAVSAAGPAANLLLALLLGLPFMLGVVKPEQILVNYYLDEMTGLDTLWTAVAFLAVLQVTAVLFNLLPFPPLDGFGILEPMLDPRTRQQFAQIGMSGIWILFMIFWFVDPVANAFWDMVFEITHTMSIPEWVVILGRDAFMFWRTPPQ